MPKVKALYSVGVARLLGTYTIPNVGGVIPYGQIIELSEELIELIGADSFELVAEEKEKTMSEETKVETTPETPASTETSVVPNAPVAPKATPADTTTPETTVV
jgi:hypothetical protein